MSENEETKAAPAAEQSAPDTSAAETKQAEASTSEASDKRPSGGRGDRGGRGGRNDRGGRGGRDSKGKGRKGDRESTDGLYEKVVRINRTAKVVKGGRRFSFSVLGVVGDQNGRVGIGMGKANGVPAAIKKALEKARANMVTIPLNRGRTIPYPVESRFSGTKMIMRPASPGTGIIAGGPARALMEALGVQDILTKKIGSSNPGNVLRATLRALQQLRSPQEVAKLRGISMRSLFLGHDAPDPVEVASEEAAPAVTEEGTA